MRTQRGFTIIELMVALTLAAILMTLAIPAFRDVGLSSQLRSVSSEFIAATHLARSEAIKQNAVVKLCVSWMGEGLIDSPSGHDVAAKEQLYHSRCSQSLAKIALNSDLPLASFVR